MANHMEAIAKELGLELNEQFQIKGHNQGKLYRLTLNGLECRIIKGGAFWFKDNGDTFFDICTDDTQIVKLPFKPKYDEGYWHVQFDEFGESDRNIRGVYTRWINSCADYSRLKTGNCFRTKEEAETNKFHIYEELTGRKWK